MAIKQWPTDFTDITGSATKLLAATSDGANGFLKINLSNVETSINYMLGLNSAGTITPFAPSSGKVFLGLPTSGGYDLNSTIKRDSVVLFVNQGSNTTPAKENLIQYGGGTSLSKILGVNTFDSSTGVGLDFIVNSPSGANTPIDALSLKSNGNADFYGNIVAGGSITPGSDKRLKKNIKTIEGNLDKILKLRPVSYTHKHDNASALGFIADEVQKLFPELVLVGKDDKKMLALNYMGLTSPIVGALQELSAKHNELQKKYDDLLARVEKLEAK